VQQREHQPGADDVSSIDDVPDEVPTVQAAGGEARTGGETDAGGQPDASGESRSFDERVAPSAPF